MPDLRWAATTVAASASVTALSGCGAARSPQPDRVGPSEVAVINQALADLDGPCAPSGSRRAARARSAVDRLVVLARRHPTARFTLAPGDEEGRMLSVLLVARYQQRLCRGPVLLALDDALPTRVRQALQHPR